MSFSDYYIWPILAIAALGLFPLAWMSWNTKAENSSRIRNLALACRGVGIFLIALAIIDPQTTGQRPVTRANIVALLADNGAGLRIKDNGEETTRGEEMKSALIGDSSNWLSKLKDEFQIRSYSFDQNIYRTNSFESLNFEGNQSNLSHALNELQTRLEGMPVAGIVLFTDGNATDQILDQEQRSELPPIFPIVLGKTDPVTDISIQNLKVSQSAFGDTPLRITATIDQTNFTDQPTRTQLRRISSKSGSLETGNIVNEKLKTLDTNNALSFEWKPSGAGIQFFEISTEVTTPSFKEATLENNKRLFAVDRGKDTYRILYVTGRPNWEYKFLNRSLSADPQLDIVGLIRVASREPNFEFKGRAGENSNSLYRGFGREDETERYDEAVLIRMNTRDEHELKTGFPDEAEELFSYDAIVIDDLEAEFFSFTQQILIRDFVKQRGGGLLVLGGVNSLEDGGYENTPISQALPIYLDGYGPSAPGERLVQWDLSRSGWVEPWMRIRSFETEERRRIQEMPWLRVYNTVQRVRPGAQTLATIKNSANDTYPALVTRKFGSGRVATLAVGDLWRWGMQNASTQADLSQFWRQISRWLISDNPSLVTLDAKTTNSASIVLTAIARDKEYHPLQLGNAELVVRKIDANERERRYNMQVVAGKAGLFQVEIPQGEDGAFLAKVVVHSADGLVLGEAETGWVNQPLVEEFSELTPNLAYLQKLADDTGGELIQISNLEKLEPALAARSSPIMETWTKPLWHNQWLFLLALGSFLAEWLLRRKRGLA